MAITSINPATEEVLGEWPEDDDRKIDDALNAVTRAFKDWRRMDIGARAGLLRSVAGVLRGRKPALAALMTAEMGKPIVESEAEIEKCAWCCDFYAGQGPGFLADIPTESSASRSYVAFDPVGPVLAIMPWNFPFWQVFRFAAPALLAGNTAVLKHAANVPGCASAIEKLLQEAGLPDGVFRSLLVSNDRVAPIIADDRIKAVTLTGSDRAGSQVAEGAGRSLKKTVLELGGSDPFIILADADIDQAVSTGVNARYQNTGQSCIAAKRFIVEETIAGAFLERFVAAVEGLTLGDPADGNTKLGPLAREDLRGRLETQVRRSLDMGAVAVTGGYRPERRGYYFAPTVLQGVEPGMPAFDEEVFGPVAAVVPARGSAHAIELANQSRYGLGAALWTSDVDNARRLARDIDTGSVFINGMVASDPRLPFGGIKRSGYGRELGEFGIREFVNIKTVWIGPAAQAQPRSE